MSSLLCIAGPPGAGKSTVSALVSARLSPSVLIQGDAFYRFLDQGAVKPWLPEATDQNRVVISASGAAAGRFVRGGYDAVFDGGPWAMVAANLPRSNRARRSALRNPAALSGTLRAQRCHPRGTR